MSWADVFELRGGMVQFRKLLNYYWEYVDYPGVFVGLINLCVDSWNCDEIIKNGWVDKKTCCFSFHMLVAKNDKYFIDWVLDYE